MPSLQSYTTTSDGSIYAPGDVYDHSDTTGDNLICLNSSSTDGLWWASAICCNTAADFAGIALADITAARLNVYINAYDLGVLGNTATLDTRIYNGMANAISTTPTDYLAGTTIDSSVPGTGWHTITFSKTLLNLSAGTNSGYTNACFVVFNGGDFGSDSIWWHFDSANKSSGNKAYIEIDYTIPSVSSPQRMALLGVM